MYIRILAPSKVWQVIEVKKLKNSTFFLWWDLSTWSTTSVIANNRSKKFWWRWLEVSFNFVSSFPGYYQEKPKTVISFFHWYLRHLGVVCVTITCGLFSSDCCPVFPNNAFPYSYRNHRQIVARNLQNQTKYQIKFIDLEVPFCQKILSGLFAVVATKQMWSRTVFDE